jgi:hypothetical protein
MNTDLLQCSRNESYDPGSGLCNHTDLLSYIYCSEANASKECKHQQDAIWKYVDRCLGNLWTKETIYSVDKVRLNCTVED